MSEATKKPHTKKQPIYSVQENQSTITIKIHVPIQENKNLRTLVNNFLKKIEQQESEYITNWSFLTDSIPYKGKAEYKNAAQTLKAYRVRENISQKELCEKLNIKQSNLSLMETGKRPIGKNLAQKLGKIFNTSSENFLTSLE